MTTKTEAHEVERELNALINSGTFGKSETLQRLLDFLVRNALLDNAENLTEAAIAVKVLQRPRGFNPTEDSTVRKTMARLREKLMSYYAGEGRSAAIRIVLERGSYRPVFMRKEQVSRPHAAVKAPRILVLPFFPINFHDSEFVTDGLMEDLMVGLAGGGGIPIVPWTTARYLREKTGDMREYRRISGADIILDGNIRRLEGDLCQITLSWVDGLTSVFDNFLQVRVNYNRTPDAIHTLVKEITGRLGSGFSEDIQHQIEARHTTNPEARSLYMRAKLANRLGTAEDTRKSFAYLARALELQPDYAAAHALLADSHIYSGISGIAPPRSEMPLAIGCAQRALHLAPKLGTALAAKGGVEFAFQWDFASAKCLLATALSMDPTSDSTHFWTEAVVAASEGPAAAASRMEEHAEADNCSAATAYLASSYCYNAGNWKRCRHWAQRAIELDPNYYRPYPFLAGACLELGEPDQALRFAESARRLTGPNPYTSGMLGIVLARTGRKAEARSVLYEHLSSPAGRTSALGEAVICAAMGDHEQTCDAIEKMIREREPYVAWLHIFPFFAGLRNNSRFQRLVAPRVKSATA